MESGLFSSPALWQPTPKAKDSSGGYQPSPVSPRPLLPSPLPRPDRDGTPWATTLPWRPPQERDYLRANLWGVEMPGAPGPDRIPGVSSYHPERILSWFLDRYDQGFQREYLKKYDGYGYSHLYVSAPDSIQGNNQTLSQFAKNCERWKRSVKYLGIMLGSKVFQPRDMKTEEWMAYVQPLLDVLLPIGDEFCVWEWDSFNIPSGSDGPSVEVPKRIGGQCNEKGKSFWMHFFPAHTWWGGPGDCPDRFSYWRHLGEDVRGMNYQGDSNWTTQMAADRAVDTLWQFGTEGNVHKFRYFEDVASLLFDGRQQYNTDPKTGKPTTPRGPGITPDDADTRGYYLCCTTDNVRRTDAKVWGFGDGGRMPDGSRI